MDIIYEIVTVKKYKKMKMLLAFASQNFRIRKKIIITNRDDNRLRLIMNIHKLSIYIYKFGTPSKLHYLSFLHVKLLTIQHCW